MKHMEKTIHLASTHEFMLKGFLQSTAYRKEERSMAIMLHVHVHVTLLPLFHTTKAECKQSQ